MADTGYTFFPECGINIPNAKMICGAFQQTAGAAPDILYGTGFSIARTAAGKYTVTLRRAFRIVAATLGICETADNADVTTHFEELTLGTVQQTFVIHSKVATVDTEVEDRQISFILVVADTSAYRTRSA